MPVQLLWSVMLHQRLQPKQNKNKNWRRRNRCSRWASTACNFLWRNYVGDFRLVEFAQHVLHWKYPKNERNKTRLILAPNRGCPGVLWTYFRLSCGTVLGFNPQKHVDKQTGACRVTLTLARSTQTHGSPREHTLLHKDINLTRTYL